MVKTQLQRRLAGKTIGQVFANFFFWNGQPLDAKSQKPFGTLGRAALRRGFRRTVAVLGVLHASQRRPVDVVDRHNLLIQKIRHDAGQVLVDIDRQAVFVFIAKHKTAVERVVERQALLDTRHVIGHVSTD